ncbi:MAG: hypothetical protein ACRDSH_23975 [Pseudonocardiaceae bacterium]
MFALVALICFILALFGTPVGIDLVALGLVFVALHLLFGMWPLGGSPPWRV